jgi:serine-type D-Ala-D-Ala carboxypeptidase/endopeptidase (penicillin-binding protein 4)
MRILLVLLAVALSSCASLPKGASKALGAADVAGTRFGLVVMTMDGKEIISVRPDERFLPASNTKLFTVGAAFHRLGDVFQPDPSMGASVRVRPNANGPPDLILSGGGDPFVIDAEDCERDCLSELADRVVANGITGVHTLIGDDTLYPDERWGPGWSREDTQFRAGAPASALVVNSNEVRLEVAPGAQRGDPVRAAWRVRATSLWRSRTRLSQSTATRTISGSSACPGCRRCACSER